MLAQRQKTNPADKSSCKTQMRSDPGFLDLGFESVGDSCTQRRESEAA